MLDRIFIWATQKPVFRKLIWRSWYNYWCRKYGNEGVWEFLNYGYSPTDPEAHRLELQEDDEQYRNWIQLYHQIASRIDLDGKELVEVGSGRGGGCSYVHRYLKPAKTTGIDLSLSSVEYCQKRHQISGLTFRQGDAEGLPLDDESVDVVLNVESSHAYQSREKFFSEVHRVLRPGGYFLITDFMEEHDREAVESMLTGAGLSLLEKQEITPDVLKALAENEEFKQQAIAEVVHPLFRGMFREFAGVEGSTIVECFTSRYIVYYRYVLQKDCADDTKE
jgi:ubiquinone/menaquinone biosynthesis C-methylase UbiE